MSTWIFKYQALNSPHCIKIYITVNYHSLGIRQENSKNTYIPLPHTIYINISKNIVQNKLKKKYHKNEFREKKGKNTPEKKFFQKYDFSALRPNLSYNIFQKFLNFSQFSTLFHIFFFAIFSTTSWYFFFTWNVLRWCHISISRFDIG